MTTLTVSGARANLYKLIDNVSSFHDPVLIVGKRSNAVLISEEDWKAIQETLHLLSIPGMREKLLKAKKESVEDCSKEIDFWPGK